MTALDGKPMQRIHEHELRMHQIDSEIARLNKQLEYLQRIRVQYAQQAEAQHETDLVAHQVIRGR